GDDGRMIALPRRVDDAERQRRRLHGGAQPRPGEARLALARAPRCEMVGAHGGAEAGLLGEQYRGEGGARGELLVRGVKADQWHASAMGLRMGEGGRLDGLILPGRDTGCRMRSCTGLRKPPAPVMATASQGKWPPPRQVPRARAAMSG